MHPWNCSLHTISSMPPFLQKKNNNNNSDNRKNRVNNTQIDEEIYRVTEWLTTMYVERQGVCVCIVPAGHPYMCVTIFPVMNKSEKLQFRKQMRVLLTCLYWCRIERMHSHVKWFLPFRYIHLNFLFAGNILLFVWVSCHIYSLPAFLFSLFCFYSMNPCLFPSLSLVVCH